MKQNFWSFLTQMKCSKGLSTSSSWTLKLKIVSKLLANTNVKESIFWNEAEKKILFDLNYFFLHIERKKNLIKHFGRNYNHTIRFMCHAQTNPFKNNFLKWKWFFLLLKYLNQKLLAFLSFINKRLKSIILKLVGGKFNPLGLLAGIQ